MNNKALLEQADYKISEAEKIKWAKQSIEDLERLIRISEDNTYDLRYCGEYDLPLEQSLNADNYKDLKQILKRTFERYALVQTVKLEQLLGIKPMILIPEFEAAVIDMEQSAVINKIDPVEEKLTKILDRNEQEITHNPNKEVDSRKKDGRRKYPPQMTIEEVKRLYITENKSMSELAEYFEVKSSTVNNFIYLNHLGRRAARKKDKPSDDGVSARQSKI